jgi:hypothetical protein
MPDLRLKMLYPGTNGEWSKRYNWPLWHEPEPADEYVMPQLHVCLDENQSEFDQQNGLLAKMMVDFLNVANIGNALETSDPPDHGLNGLEAFLLEGSTAAEQGLAEEEALKKGMAKKSREFTGSELYAKA